MLFRSAADNLGAYLFGALLDFDRAFLDRVAGFLGAAFNDVAGLAGVLLQVGIDVDVDGERRRVALGDVLQARTLFEWGPTPKSGGARGAASSRPDRPEPAVASAVSEDRR